MTRPAPSSQKRRKQSLPATVQRWLAWLRVKRLQRELRHSQAFQKECERLGCFTLAELEETHRRKVQEKIRRLT